MLDCFDTEVGIAFQITEKSGMKVLQETVLHCLCEEELHSNYLAVKLD